ncbi:MAG: transcriptional repressor [Clostridia bacterium]|nr:transcriptional repressor [Clostridia bacterium]
MKAQRSTAQKKIIHKALVEAGHPTATELYEIVHRENEHISKATVFRVLSQFADNGEIRRLSIRGSDERFDATMSAHAHMRCVQCGKIFDVMTEELEGILGAKYIQGCEIYSAELEYAGRCLECMKKTEENLPEC